MKAYYTFILLFGALLTSTTASAQNIQTATIEWNCNSMFVQQTGSISDEITKVVSSPTQIIWYDSNGVVKKIFEITGSVGAWSNTSVNGTILFRIGVDNEVGLVRFEKSGSTIKIKIDLGIESELMVYELTVDNLNTL